MAEPLSYCEAVKELDEGNVHRVYHDTAYGFPLADDDQLFERLILEINQAGLSWTTILNKQANFSKAYDRFSIATVAGYGQDDIDRLLADAGIIRNRLKINAAIYNANAVLELQKTAGSFRAWLEAQHFSELRPAERVKIFRGIFKFVGGEIVNEFLVSTGYVPGAHTESCPIGLKIASMRR